MRPFLLAVVSVAAISLATDSAKADAPGDTALASTVAKNLKSSGRLEKYRVGVKCTGGTAYLLGSVINAEQERAAVEVARATPGVRHVVSKLAHQEADRARADIQQPPIQQPQGLVTRSSHNEPVGPDLVLQPPASPAVTAPSPAPAPSANAVYNQTHVEKRAASLARQATQRVARSAGPPLPFARRTSYDQMAAGEMAGQMAMGQPIPAYVPTPSGVSPARFDQPHMPGYAWPSYASYPNYAALTYPQQYSPTAWPFIGPFYPYPQVPLGWRKVTLEWDDGWWQLDFKD